MPSTAAFLVPDSEAAMDAREQLARRIASANDCLRAAQRARKIADIMLWLKERDDLLDQYPRTSRPQETST